MSSMIRHVCKHPKIAQLVERETVVCLSSLGPWFKSGFSDTFCRRLRCLSRGRRHVRLLLFFFGDLLTRNARKQEMSMGVWIQEIIRQRQEWMAIWRV
ncbi:hypothetical protein B0O80DRAFT_204231 [Mortierella sp. GBAus27b]|nr:hypothetical protein B0O80DRAFT_204231 [Mortierella sp. GBAus27b]